MQNVYTLIIKRYTLRNVNIESRMDVFGGSHSRHMKIGAGIMLSVHRLQRGYYRVSFFVLCSSVAVMSNSSEAAQPHSSSKDPLAHSSGTASRKRNIPKSSQATQSASEKIEVTGKTFVGSGVSNTTPGGGLMPSQTVPYSQSGLTRDYIAKQSPTTNINALVASLPGVISATQDPLGMSGNDTLNMRGMTQAQVGYIFEGAPIADPISYQPFTSMLADTENLGSVSVRQGAADIATPTYNAVGGQITAEERTPSSKRSLYMDFLGGTKSANKEFIRVDTGEINHTGVRGFVSFSYTSADNWRGPGESDRYHVDAKFVKEWAPHSKTSLVFGFNQQTSTAWRYPTAALWNQYGTSYNYEKDYNTAGSLDYKLHINKQNSVSVTAPSRFQLADGLSLDFTPYWVHQSGPAISTATIPESGGYFGTEQYGNLGIPGAVNGKLTAVSVDPWRQTMSGFTSSLKWARGFNELSIGYWYTYAVHAENQAYVALNGNGTASNLDGKYPIRLPDGRQLSGYNLNFKQQVNALYIADQMKFLKDRLRLQAGFKAVMLSREGTNDVPGADPSKGAKNDFAPLPQVAISYDIDKSDQIFVNGTTAFRAPSSANAYVARYSVSSPLPASLPSDLKSEYSIGEEIGYRHKGFVNISASLFNYNMTNHQISTSSYLSGTTTLISQVMNSGGQTSRGAQVEIGLRWWHHFSPYVSAQYLHATMDNNFSYKGDVLATKGKIAVASPEFTAAVGLQYDNGRFFSNFNLRYVSSQYTTFMNDESMPGYLVSDLTVGYRFNNFSYFRHPQLQLNFVNIGSNNYRSAAASFTPTAKGSYGLHGNYIAGSSPIYYIGGSFAALASVSVAIE